MARIQMSMKGYRMTSLDLIIPETEARAYPVLWLLHDAQGRGDDFLRYTGLEGFCRKTPWYVICVSVGNSDYRDRPLEDHANWESYVTEYLWELVHRIFPQASKRSSENFLAGKGTGGEAARRLCQRHPWKYGNSRWLSETDADNWEQIGKELEEIIKNC